MLTIAFIYVAYVKYIRQKDNYRNLVKSNAKIIRDLCELYVSEQETIPPTTAVLLSPNE